MDITLLICALFLFILAILLYIGKLSNMIAGYNTLSAKEKEQYYLDSIMKDKTLKDTSNNFVLHINCFNLRGYKNIKFY